ncbi:MAG: hypothetical protein KQH63_07675 [Desulfobulbaceae bacterium]|nr:hypothetical protein [Desulfobulbaceae bacterium]
MKILKTTTGITKKSAILFLSFVFTLVLMQSVSAAEGQWHLSRDLFGRDRNIRIACVDEAVHAVWYRENELLWSYSEDGDLWSKPVELFQDSGGSLELVSDGKNLHLFFFTSANIGYIFYNGESWSREKQVLKTRENPASFHISMAGDKIHLFWSKWHYSKLIHGPMHLSLMHSILENNEWTESIPVPPATNVDRSFTFSALPDGRLELAWIQNTMGKLGKDFGMTFGLAHRILMTTSYDPQTKKWDEPVKHSTLQKDAHCEIHLKEDSMGLLHLYWVEGSLSTKLRWRLRRQEKWEDVRIFKSLQGPTNAALALSPHGDVLCLTQSDNTKAGLSLIVAPGTARERIYHAPNPVSHSLQEVSLAVSPSGIVHYAAGHHYGRFIPPDTMPF